MKRINYLLPMIVLLCVAAYYFIQNTAAEDGDNAPNFEATLVDGSSFELSDLKGEYVLLKFWASWCGPCIKSNKKLVRLHNKYPNKLNVVSIALEKRGESWKKTAHKLGMDWKHQIVEKHKLVVLSEIARKYGVVEIPAKFLISPDGKLMADLTFEEIDVILSNS